MDSELWAREVLIIQMNQWCRSRERKKEDILRSSAVKSSFILALKDPISSSLTLAAFSINLTALSKRTEFRLLFECFGSNDIVFVDL